MDNRNNSNPPYTYDPDNTPTYEPFNDMTATRTDKAVSPSDIKHSPLHTHQPYTYKNDSESGDIPQKEWDNQDTMMVPPSAAPHDDTKIYGEPQSERQTPPPLKPVRRQQPAPPPQPYQQNSTPYQQSTPYQTSNFPQPPPYQPPVVPHYEPPMPSKPRDNDRKHEEKKSGPTLIILIILLAVMIVLLLVFGGIFLFKNKDDGGENSISYSSSSVSDINRDITDEELQLPDTGGSWISVIDYNKIYDHEPYVELVENLSDNSCFFLCDISGEGTPELFITSESNAIKTIYTLDDNGVSKLLDCSSEESGKLDLCTNGMIAHTYKDGDASEITYLKFNGGSFSPFETVEKSDGELHYSYNGQRIEITSKEADKIHSRYASMQFTPTLAAAVESATSSINAYIETFDHSALDYFSSYLVASGDFDHIEVSVKGPENQDISYNFAKSDCNASLFLLDYKEYSADAYVEITPYDSENKAGEKIKCVFPSAIKNTIKDKVKSEPINTVKGVINCPDEQLQGFDSSYVLDGGDVKIVCDKIDHDCRITAKNKAFNYGVHWYELWNSENGDYYGWVDEKFINFNISQDNENDQQTTPQQPEATNPDNDNSDFNFWKDLFS